MSVRFISNWNLEVLVVEERENAVPGEKPLGAKERINNKLNTHMASIWRGRRDLNPDHWEVSALTAAPPLLLQYTPDLKRHILAS